LLISAALADADRAITDVADGSRGRTKGLAAAGCLLSGEAAHAQVM
jgi:hypothetical protein